MSLSGINPACDQAHKLSTLTAALPHATLLTTSLGPPRSTRNEASNPPSKPNPGCLVRQQKYYHANHPATKIPPCKGPQLPQHLVNSHTWGPPSRGINPRSTFRPTSGGSDDWSQHRPALCAPTELFTNSFESQFGDLVSLVCEHQLIYPP